MTSLDSVSTHVWLPEDRSVSVEITLPILEQIRSCAVAGVSSFRHGGLEVGGVLYGVWGEKSARILAYAELASEHALGPTFRLSETDLKAFSALMEAPPGLQTIGFFRSHTRRGGEDLDDNDRNLFDRFFQSPGQVAFTLKPSAWGYATAAFFVRSEGGAIRGCPGKEFTVDPLKHTPDVTAAPPDPIQYDPDCTVPGRDASTMNGADVDPPADVAPSVPDVPAGVALLQRRYRMPRLRRWWVLPLAASIFILVQYRNWSGPRPLALSAEAFSPGEVRIEWSYLSPFPSGAMGSMEIRDGDMDVKIRLDSEQLRLNNLIYAHRSNELQIRMRIDLGMRTARLEQAIGFVAPPSVLKAVALTQEPLVESQSPTPSADRHQVDPLVVSIPGARGAGIDPETLTPLPLKRLSGQRRQLSLETITKPTLAGVRQLPELPAPPTVAFVVAPTIHSDLLPATKPPALAPPLKYSGPRSGRLIWTGTLAKRGVVEIDGSTASIGSLAGALPGMPVSYAVAPAEFTSRGLTVYSPDPRKSERIEPPNSNNGWNSTQFEYYPERARELVVLEPPTAINDFRRLVLRNDARTYYILVIDWEMR